MNLERKRPEYPYDKVLHQYVTRGREYLEEEYYAEALAEFDKVLAFLKVDRLRLRKRPQNEKYTLNNLYRKASSGRDDALMGLGRVAEAREARRAVLAGLPYPD
jgi:tetratricopeptide (TPR) repeat protein